jgi:serine acetyltransferase
MINNLRIKLFYNPISKIICRINGIPINKNLIFNGIISIKKKKGSLITIGDNCRFHSRKYALPILLQSPCRFVTLQKDAKITFGKNSGASGATIVAASEISIGENVLIGSNTTIVDTNFHSTEPTSRNQTDLTGKKITIENNAFIGMNSLILKGVTIGENSFIGANSVVANNIPPNSIAMGNPCKVIIKRRW